MAGQILGRDQVEAFLRPPLLMLAHYPPDLTGIGRGRKLPIRLDAATDDRYVRYVVARLAAFRNVWWSMANEWDLARSKTMADWDRYFRIAPTFESPPAHPDQESWPCGRPEPEHEYGEK